MSFLPGLMVWKETVHTAYVSQKVSSVVKGHAGTEEKEKLVGRLSSL